MLGSSESFRLRPDDEPMIASRRRSGGMRPTPWRQRSRSASYELSRRTSLRWSGPSPTGASPSDGSFESSSESRWAWREFEWVGRTISVGGAVLKVVKRTVRCEGVNVDPRGSGRADLDVPALLQKHFPQHGPFLGVYAQVVSAGEVRVGDRVRVSPAG